MARRSRTIEEMIQALPAELREEVRRFVSSLAAKRKRPAPRRPRFGWAGALKQLRGRYTSVELQHEISRWRIGAE